jgi:hypothetical protein
MDTNKLEDLLERMRDWAALKSMSPGYLSHQESADLLHIIGRLNDTNRELLLLMNLKG